MMTLGKIPYLNSVLFYHPLESMGYDDLRFEPLVPRQLSGAVVESKLDAGPVPLVTTWDIEDRYEPLGDFCIATKTKAMSILFYSKYPIEALDRATIGVTAQTSTSVRLIKVLLSERYGLQPGEFTTIDRKRNDAFLLIGDEALIHRGGVDGFPHVNDLGEVWNEWTGLPFVFARWVVKRSLDDAVKLELSQRLGKALDTGWKEFDEAVASKCRELDISVEDARAYLEGFEFRMTAKTHEAVARFRSLDAVVTPKRQLL